MSSVGRGRGRGSNLDKVILLRRPGEVVQSTDMAIDRLISAIQGINLHSADESVDALERVEELLKSQCQTEENLRWIIFCLE